MSEPEDRLSIERKRRQSARNAALFFALLAFVVLVYAITIIKMKLGYGP
jgi:hypothetical protein